MDYFKRNYYDYYEDEPYREQLNMAQYERLRQEHLQLQEEEWRQEQEAQHAASEFPLCILCSVEHAGVWDYHRYTWHDEECWVLETPE